MVIIDTINSPTNHPTVRGWGCVASTGHSDQTLQSRFGAIVIHALGGAAERVQYHIVELKISPLLRIHHHHFFFRLCYAKHIARV
jgi:hypothetical protein